MNDKQILLRMQNEIKDLKRKVNKLTDNKMSPIEVSNQLVKDDHFSKDQARTIALYVYQELLGE